MSRPREFIAYSGEKFTIEWFYDEKGISQPLCYFETLDEVEQDKTLYLFKRMGNFGRISDTTKFNFEGDGVYAFKPQPHRFLSFFIIGKKIIITNAYRKKTDKLPKSEKEMALKRKINYKVNQMDSGHHDKRSLFPFHTPCAWCDCTEECRNMKQVETIDSLSEFATL